MSELGLGTTITKLLAGLEKSINDTRDSQSAEMKSHQAQIQKALTEMLQYIIESVQFPTTATN